MWSQFWNFYNVSCIDLVLIKSLCNQTHQLNVEPFAKYFQLGERYFIGMDSSSYMLNFDYGKDAMIKQNMWLETLMRHIPKEAPKTVFLHTPLFVEYPEEVKLTKKIC